MAPPWGAGGEERQHPIIYPSTEGYSSFYPPSKRRIDDCDDGEDYHRRHHHHHQRDYRRRPPAEQLKLKRTRADRRFSYDVPFLAEPEPELEPGLGPGTGPDPGEPEQFVLLSSEQPLPLPLPLPLPAVTVATAAPEFLVLREHGVTARRTAEAPIMERTASGLSIRSDTTERCASTELLEDDEAAQRVRDHMASFRRRFPDSKHERILRSIVNPRSLTTAEYPLDNDSLESIFSAANEIFFNGRLSQRVTWDWSHESSAQYDAKVIGTTALRRASNRGFETLIVLSSPILRDPCYSRRLLISTFLHELIHCYMFICCGFRARHCGGHTPGFRQIARLVDDWVGPDSMLYLSKMEADLERFRIAGTGGHDYDYDYDHDLNLERRSSRGSGSGGGSMMMTTTASRHHHPSSSAALSAIAAAAAVANVLPCSGCCHVGGEEEQQQQQATTAIQPDSCYLSPHVVRRGQRLVRSLHGGSSGGGGGEHFGSSIRFS